MMVAPIEAQIDQGSRVSLELSLGGPQFQVFRHQALWEGPFRGQPMVTVGPQETRRPIPYAVQRAEGWAEVRVLARGSQGPSVLAQGAFEGRWGLGGA